MLDDEYILKHENELMNEDITELFDSSAHNSVQFLDGVQEFKVKTNGDD